MERLILPKEIVEVDDSLIFLAGPISGAPLWHDKAIETIRAFDKSIYLASPHKRIEETQEKNNYSSDEKFLKQLDWERHYLDIASKIGAILFWLPVCKSHNCNRTYARDTRGELGEWRGRLHYDKSINLVIGGEEQFDGLDIIKRNFLAIDSYMEFYKTLEDTCKAAVSKAREKYRKQNIKYKQEVR